MWHPGGLVSPSQLGKLASLALQPTCKWHPGGLAIQDLDNRAGEEATGGAAQAQAYC